MEYLRWILLVVGLFFVLIIYLIGRNRKRKDTYNDYGLDEDTPEFSAQDWNEMDEGVGAVRIIAREDSGYDSPDYDAVTDESEYDVQDAEEISRNNQSEMAVEEKPEEKSPEESSEQQGNNADIIVLYILARSSNKLSGDKINSAAQANGLVFGKMNIFHRLDDSGQSAFSLANMVEPGNFNPNAMHEIETPGIIFFMQATDVADPDGTFDDMLQCAYHMSEMLDAQLCNRKRQPFTQSDAEQYREDVRMSYED